MIDKFHENLFMSDYKFMIYHYTTHISTGFMSVEHL